MITTATVTCGPTLRARVEVLREINEMFYEVKVIEGRGGWDKPGKIFVARKSIVSDISTDGQLTEATPAPVRTPRPAVVKPVDLPILVEAPELVEARAELTRLEKALIANFLAPGGGRGKQGLRRTNAQIRRGAQYARQVKAAQARVNALLDATR